MSVAIEIKRNQLEPIHYDSVLGRYVDSLSMYNYLKNEVEPHLKEMEKCEAKEYQENIDSNIVELKELAGILINEPYFIPMMLKYGLKVEDIKYSIKDIYNE